MTTHEDQIASARALAVNRAPYFASVIYGFVFQAVEDSGTMFCTPKLILGYDPAWAMEATVQELAADIVHEVHHIIRDHFVRGARADDPKLFAMAGDLAINPDMVAGGWKLANESSSRPAIFPRHFGLPDGKSTEEYYELLKRKKEENEGRDPEPDQASPPKTGQQTSQKPSPPKPSPSPSARPASSPLPKDSGQDPGQGSGQAGGQDKPEPRRGIAQGHCGGISGSPALKELEDKLDAQPGLGREPAEVVGIQKKLAADMKAFAEQHGRWSIPGKLLDWADVFDDEAHVRWQDELANVLRASTGRLQAGGEDFSLRRPSKRSIMRGFPRPGMVEQLPEVAVVRDTSGSMGAKQLTDACREAYYIAQALGIDEVWFTDADTEVAGGWKRVSGEFFKTLREVHGRGGTDFRPAIESALHLEPKPDLLVYVTDGDGATTEMPPPDLAVVWCIVPSYYNKAPAKWGYCVIVTDDPKKRKAPAV